MRIVHLSTYDISGGAARSAFRLHQALLAAGEQSAMLVVYRRSKLASVHQVPAVEDARVFFGDLLRDRYLHQNRSDLTNTYFSLGWPGQDVSHHPLVQQADLLHLHWVGNFQSAATLARLEALGKPMVWSLHDQRPFTGGCHFTAGCNRFETQCNHCPQLLADPANLTTANLVDQLPIGKNITIVAPSRWMADAASRSAVFRNSRIEVIPYGIETDRFCPQTRTEARKKLGLSPRGVLFLFGADNGGEKRKGFAELSAALELCLKDAGFRERIENGQLGLLAFGEQYPEVKRLSSALKLLGRIDSDEKLSTLYCAADWFLLPSLEDNLPNTALEAMSCGTPVIAFRAGGIPDLVIEGFTGRLAPAGDIEALSRLLLTASHCSRPSDTMSGCCRRYVEEHFTLRQQADKCLALYRELLRSAPGAPDSNRASSTPEPGIAPDWNRALREPAASRGLNPSTADAAERFQKALPLMLRQVLTMKPEQLPLPARPELGPQDLLNRTEFLKWTKRSTEAAAAGRLSHSQLMARLEEELVVVRGTLPTPNKAKLLLHRVLDTWKQLSR